MLSIAKLRVGQEAYQLSGVAQSLDDYYTGAGEAEGEWLGASAARLGLEGLVDGADLRAVLAGIAPGTGGRSPNGDTIAPHPRRVPGFDLTFKAPKSVSVLYAVSDDPRVQGAIIEAGDAAVRAAIGWLERDAIHVRRGTGNERFLDSLAARDPDAADAARIRTMPARGVAAAMFRHRTSRAGDPLLHWHTLVANLVEGPDGRWSAFVHPDLYRAVRAAGEVFQTVLRHELTERLGIQWRPGRHVPEVAGIPQALNDQFSKRSTEIDAWLEATGTPATSDGRQQAVLATRRAKPEVESERFDAAWKAEALAAGWGPDEAAALIAELAPHADPDDDHWLTAGTDRVVDAEAWIAAVLDELTTEDSTFGRPDLTRAVAARLGDGATITTIERLVARTLASPQTVPITATTEQPRWTASALLQIERRFLTKLDPDRHPRTPLPVDVVERALADHPTLGADQAHAVRALAAAPGGVAVLVGPAGTGKTFALAALRSAYEAAGYEVLGAAPSARAALELEAGAAIPSATLHRRMGEWDRGYTTPSRRTVLVVDEAAMAGIRDLEPVTRAVLDAGGRVVLAGDHRQLPEVTAGGGFAAAVGTDGVAVAELTVNRRQREPWEQAALVELRAGHVPAAVNAYLEHGRVLVGADQPTMLQLAVDRWFDAHAEGHAAVLIGGTNATVDALNRAVRQRLDQDGLAGPVLGTIDGRDYRQGEQVVLRHNAYRLLDTTGTPIAVTNGQAATAAGLDDDGLTVALDGGRHVRLPASYVAEGGVDYGYALTSHRAQGGTWDVAIGVGLDGLYRESAYLQLSRGRHENWLVTTGPELDAVDADLDRHDSTLQVNDTDPDAELYRRLDRSRAKLLALAHDPHGDEVAALATTVPFNDLEAWASHAQAVTTAATNTVGATPAAIEAKARRVEEVAAAIAPGVHVKALDRHNIGTVLDIDHQAGLAHVEFVAADGRTATRTLDFGDLQLMDPTGPDHRTSAAATAAVGRARTDADGLLRTWHRHLADRGVGPDDAHIYSAAARSAQERTAATLAYERPPWLLDLLGPRPTGALPAQAWDDTIHDVAGAALRQGAPPGTAPELTADAARALAETRVWLADYTDTPSAPPRVRTEAELTERLDALDRILEGAPPDCRSIATEIATGQLSFAETTQVLADALASRDERGRWILAHWPHIVERGEVTHALHPDPTLEPDPTASLDLDDLVS